MSWWRMALDRSVGRVAMRQDPNTARLPGRVLQLCRQRWRRLIAAVTERHASVAQPVLPADPTLTELPPLPRMAYVGEVRFAIECTLAADASLMVRLWQMETQAVYARVSVDDSGQLVALTLNDPPEPFLEHEFRQRLVGIRLDAPPPPSLRWPILLRLDWGHGASVSVSGSVTTAQRETGR